MKDPTTTVPPVTASDAVHIPFENVPADAIDPVMVVVVAAVYAAAAMVSVFPAIDEIYGFNRGMVPFTMTNPAVSVEMFFTTIVFVADTYPLTS
jgi:hypothetical protein